GVPKKRVNRKCSKCASEVKQPKVGKLPSGSQRYRCSLCGCKYTPEKKPHAYSLEVRQKAVQMYVDGANFRRIARHLGVNPQSVANWVKAHAEPLPAASLPETVEKAEMDELFTFIGDKKQNLHHRHRRSQNTLHPELVCCLEAHRRSPSKDGG
ncbi:MAG: helix-turn-helix domain-containing protein, partial [Anaerolineales bacterium]|nr:helix-turn-helix domain-containing protein [Anaerolineales bacterium]